MSEVIWKANISEDKMAVDPAREKSLADYRKKLLEHKEVQYDYFITYLFFNIISSRIT